MRNFTVEVPPACNIPSDELLTLITNWLKLASAVDVAISIVPGRQTIVWHLIANSTSTGDYQLLAVVEMQSLMTLPLATTMTMLGGHGDLSEHYFARSVTASSKVRLNRRGIIGFPTIEEAARTITASLIKQMK